MKKNLARIALLFATFSAEANCTLFADLEPHVQRLVNKHNGWVFNNYQTICDKLKSQNAAVRVVASKGVLVGRSYGWAALMVKDKNSSISTNEYNSTMTFVHADASTSVADEMMWNAINKAFEEWYSLDSALEVLNAERKAVLKAKSTSAVK